MTLAKPAQFELMINALDNIADIFKEKTTINVVVTQINFDSIDWILNLSRNKSVKVKLLEMTNGKQLSRLYVPFSKIKRYFKGENIEYINSCCPSNSCKLCKKLYPVVRINPEGRINSCIMNENAEENILKYIKNKNETYIKKSLLTCLNFKTKRRQR
jgi:molybdenum cofactor biosynthesis enzyme MoaA